MNNSSIVTDINHQRLSTKKKIIASLSSISGCIDMLMIQTFLLYFYTDVLKINVAFAGSLILIARIVSAFAAPVFGIWLDRTTTPWGKYKPFYLILGIPVAILGFFTFSAFNLNSIGKCIYASITYLLYNLFFSLSGIPKGAMGPAMTKNLEDRVSLGLLGYIFSVIGSLMAVAAGPVLIKILGGSIEARGFSLTMAVFGVLSIIISILQWFSLEERYVNQNNQTAGKIPVKTILAAAFQSKTGVIALLLVFTANLANGVRFAINLHYLKYYLHKPELMAQMGVLSMVFLFGGALISPIITRRLGVKINLLISAGFNILTFLLIFFVPSSGSGIILFILLVSVNNFFNGLSTPPQSTLLPYAIDYCEWKTGINAGAFINSLNTFVATAATAIAGLLVGIILSSSGYQPDVEQSKASLTGIKCLMSLAPAAISLLSFSILWLDHTEAQQKKIVQELMERRNNKKLEGKAI